MRNKIVIHNIVTENIFPAGNLQMKRQMFVYYYNAVPIDEGYYSLMFINL